MLKVGLTGGIGVGKSTVSKVFALLEIPIYEADFQAKLLIENNHEVKRSLIELFGEKVYMADGTYNRILVAEKVFENKKMLDQLNEIVHPAVGIDFENFCNNYSSSTFIIKEAAIMSKNQGLDKIIVVTSPLELRIKRIKARDLHRTEQQIAEIIKNQKSQEEFLAMADFEIKNNESEMLFPQILAIHKKILTFS